MNERMKKTIFALSCRMSEPAVPPVIVEDFAKLAQRVHFDAVFLERALQSICGSPSCAGSVKLRNTKTMSGTPTKNPELTEKRCFCCDDCYHRTQKYSATLADGTTLPKEQVEHIVNKYAPPAPQNPTPVVKPVAAVKPVHRRPRVRGGARAKEGRTVKMLDDAPPENKPIKMKTNIRPKKGKTRDGKGWSKAYTIVENDMNDHDHVQPPKIAKVGASAVEGYQPRQAMEGQNQTEQQSSGRVSASDRLVAMIGKSKKNGHRGNLHQEVTKQMASLRLGEQKAESQRLQKAKSKGSSAADATDGTTGMPREEGAPCQHQVQERPATAPQAAAPLPPTAR
jgi:hypothetical protein